MNNAAHKNGCFNRNPLVNSYRLTGGGMQKNFSAGAPCEYTKSVLGQADKGCTGCKWKQA
jgi:hypothetical protein